MNVLTRLFLFAQSQHLLHALEANGIKNWVSLSEGQQGALGWLTTAERKEQMCLLLREAMNVGRIALSDFFFSTELELLEAKKRIKDELLNVREPQTRKPRPHRLIPFCSPWQYCVVTEVRLPAVS